MMETLTLETIAARKSIRKKKKNVSTRTKVHYNILAIHAQSREKIVRHRLQTIYYIMLSFVRLYDYVRAISLVNIIMQTTIIISNTHSIW